VNLTDDIIPLLQLSHPFHESGLVAEAFQSNPYHAAVLRDFALGDINLTEDSSDLS
jgi:hypothetical protein